MTTFNLTPADLQALRQGHTLKRPGGPTILLMLSEEALEMERERQERMLKELKKPCANPSCVACHGGLWGGLDAPTCISVPSVLKAGFLPSLPICDHDA